MHFQSTRDIDSECDAVRNVVELDAFTDVSDRKRERVVQRGVRHPRGAEFDVPHNSLATRDSAARQMLSHGEYYRLWPNRLARSGLQAIDLGVL